MGSMRIGDVTESLYRRLEEAAERNHRSVEEEVVARLERSLVTTAPKRSVRDPALRRAAPVSYLTDDVLRAWRASGRK